MATPPDPPRPSGYSETDSDAEGGLEGDVRQWLESGRELQARLRAIPHNRRAKAEALRDWIGEFGRIAACHGRPGVQPPSPPEPPEPVPEAQPTSAPPGFQALIFRAPLRPGKDPAPDE